MDFTAYNAARAVTNEKVSAAQAATGLNASAEQVFVDAQANLSAAEAAKSQAFADLVQAVSEWELALKAEYAEAEKLWKR